MVLAIPGPVVVAYLTVLIAMLFLIGVKVVLQDGLDYRKGLIVGVVFWVGVGFQYDMIFPEDDGAVLEFVAASREENLENRIALLGEESDDGLGEREVSLRLLRHLASSVRHQQYHDIDIVKAPG